MLKRSRKLKSRYVFSRIKKDFFALLRSKFFLVLASNRGFLAEQAKTQVAVIISRKKEKSAVKRNRAKRLIEESFRSLERSKELKRKKELKYLIFLPSPKIFGASFQEVLQELTKIFD